MLKVGTITILEKQIEILRLAGIDDIVVVKGFAEHQISIEGVRYYIDEEHCHNMVYSLFCAEQEIEGDVIISYGDILYEISVIKELMEAQKGDVMVVTDLLWKEYFCERFPLPYNEAESLKYDLYGNITDIGRSSPDPKDVQAQYIGLIKLTRAGSKIFRDKYATARLIFSQKTWLRERIFENIYMTDFLQFLIDEGINIKSIPINHGWLEFDTVTDYEKVLSWIENRRILHYCDIGL
jgi:choline kinase